MAIINDRVAGRYAQAILSLPMPKRHITIGGVFLSRGGSVLECTSGLPVGAQFITERHGMRDSTRYVFEHASFDFVFCDVSNLPIIRIVHSVTPQIGAVG